MDEQYTQVAGLQTCLIRDTPATKITIVFLHGYGMRPADLSPFAHSLGIPEALFVIPQAPIPAVGTGYSWWSVPEEERAAMYEHEPRDLADRNPPGRKDARVLICQLLAALRAAGEEGPLLLAGFSQGAMLACDTVLLEAVRVAGLVMMSSSRIAFGEWLIHRAKLRGMRAFVSHGRADPDLAFAAGEQLKHFLSSSGAAVTWMPFDGGHEIPFTIWRQFRRFAHETLRDAALTPKKTLQYGTH